MQVLRFVISPLDVSSEGETCDVEIPKGANVLPGIGVTSKGIVVYAIADRESIEDAPTETRSFFVCGNGVDLPEGAGATTFRGTFKPGPGSPTWHVFDLVSVPAAS